VRPLSRFLSAPGCVAMALVALTPMFMAGCATVKTIQRKTERAVKALPLVSSPYKTKMILLPVENSTVIPTDMIDGMFTRPFQENLAADCPSILVIPPGDKDFPAALADPPRADGGTLDNMALVRLGREGGWHAVVLCRVAYLDAEEREKGIFIFRDKHYYASVQINIQVFDTGSGAKLMDEGIRCEREVDGGEFDGVKTQDARQSIELGECLIEIATDGADKLCETVSSQPWEAFVVEASEAEAVISMGAEVGLKAGDRLDLHQIGETITGNDGRQFILPGRKAGEVVIQTVLAGRATIAADPPVTITPGFSIRAQ